MKKIALSLALAALVGTAVLARNASREGFSPAKDMPGEWFFHQSQDQADAHAAYIGKPAPAIQTAKWFQGEAAAKETKGKVVILDLWATWCGPCREAMPHSSELSVKYKDKGVVVMGICSSGEEAEVEPFIKEHNLKLPMAWDHDEATYKSFGAMWYPTYVAIDKKGIVRAIGLTPEHVEDVIKMLVAEK